MSTAHSARSPAGGYGSFRPGRRAPAPASRGRVPWLLLLRGLSWLAVFFLIPLITLVSMSLQIGSLAEGYRLTWNWSTYTGAWSTYGDQLVPSFLYAGSATILALLIGYPLRSRSGRDAGAT